MKKKKSVAGKVLKAGLVIGAAAGAAYMLLGPNGKKNQEKLKKFAGKVKKEVLKDAKILSKDAKIAKKVIAKEVKKFKK